MIIKPNIENRALRKLLWKKKNPFYVTGIVILFVMGYFMTQILSNKQTSASTAFLIILFGFVVYFIFALFYRKIAYKIFSKEEIENKKREIQESLVYKAISGPVKILRAILIAVVVFILLIGLAMLSTLFD